MALFPAGWDYLSSFSWRRTAAKAPAGDGLAKPGLVTTLVKMEK
jgi:hypothetical protein